MPNFELEESLKDKGYENIVGVDEASRGSLIGPVFAGAVVIPLKALPQLQELVRDSKKLSEKKREEAAKLIKATCIWTVATADNYEIDKINILQATKLAIKRAVSVLFDAEYIIIDGNMDFTNEFSLPYQSIIKGDNTSLSIAAASIVAKSAQCSYMYELHKEYPMYGLKNNKGYGTKQHRDSIVRFGPCEVHRKSFKRVREYI